MAVITRKSTSAVLLDSNSVLPVISGPLTPYRAAPIGLLESSTCQSFTRHARNRHGRHRSSHRRSRNGAPRISVPHALFTAETPALFRGHTGHLGDARASSRPGDALSTHQARSLTGRIFSSPLRRERCCCVPVRRSILAGMLEASSFWTG